MSDLQTSIKFCKNMLIFVCIHSANVKLIESNLLPLESGSLYLAGPSAKFIPFNL